MKLEYVEMAGFRGFRDKVRFDLPSGFAVLSGRNGSGKSTLFDGVDFALTGTINKFAVNEARGGGLAEHIWWVGDGEATEHYVSVGFVGEKDDRLTITRSRKRGRDLSPQAIMGSMCVGNVSSTISDLMQSTLIRDERISALSLDLPEQARFAAVRAAIGGLLGPDYSRRAEEIESAAKGAKARQDERIKDLQAELGRVLGELTEARSAAERSAGITEAMKTIEAAFASLPDGLAARTEFVRRSIADRQVVIRELEDARASAQELLPEIQFLSSPGAAAEGEKARLARGQATEQKAAAAEALQLAMSLEQSERDSDEYLAHLAALLSHGSAVGLQHGHCPLCGAARGQEDFQAAIAKARERLAGRGKRLAEATVAVSAARARATVADRALTEAEERYAALARRAEVLQGKLSAVRLTFLRLSFPASESDPATAQKMIFAEREKLVRLERALSVLDASSAIDRVGALESKVAVLRARAEQEAARLASVTRAVESARQITNAAKTVANEILTEQFDTVMPLLRELFRRLRPHADWTEIESDFGGKVRASLNFTVGAGHNPQFLFSSGQRRAAGLAFLLSVHLSRPWCKWRTLLMDDPVQHIDDYRALNLVEVLAAIRRTGRQVIVAAEDAALANVLCRRLRSANEEAGRYFELRTAPSGGAEIADRRDIYPMPRLVLRQAQAS
ncbi:MAG: AAA family ATPase [Gemmataceae bacterium]